MFVTSLFENKRLYFSFLVRLFMLVIWLYKRIKESSSINVRWERSLLVENPHTLKYTYKITDVGRSGVFWIRTQNSKWIEWLVSPLPREFLLLSGFSSFIIFLVFRKVFPLHSYLLQTLFKWRNSTLSAQYMGIINALIHHFKCFTFCRNKMLNRTQNNMKKSTHGCQEHCGLFVLID